MKQWNVAILGTGAIAAVMADTLNGMEEARLYAVGSRTLDRARAFAEKYGAEKACGSYEELVADPQVELVYIATPHSEHWANALLCIRAGKPVLCEKAFTANAAQAREVFAEAERRVVLAHRNEVAVIAEHLRIFLQISPVYAVDAVRGVETVVHALLVTQGFFACLNERYALRREHGGLRQQVEAYEFVLRYAGNAGAEAVNQAHVVMATDV